MIFDLSKSNIPRDKRIWVIWAINKNALTGTPENTFLRKHKLKTSKAIFFFFEKVLLSNCDIWSLQKQHSRKSESELFEPYRKNHFTGAPENIFLCKVDTYLNLP